MTLRTCKIEGRTYKIPDIWLAGFNGTPLEAVQHWHAQQLLSEQWECEHDPRPS